MPTTRKKIVKTSYKDDTASDLGESGDFSDSGSEAYISEQSESSEGNVEDAASSENSFTENAIKKQVKTKRPPTKKGNFAKNFINKINNQREMDDDDEIEIAPAFSLKDLTEADKLLPSILNLSESDSSDDEQPTTSRSFQNTSNKEEKDSDESEVEAITEYEDVWSKNLLQNSDEVAKRTFEKLQQHASKIEETKSTLKQYNLKKAKEETNVTDLLAQGEEMPSIIIKKKNRKVKNESESELEDWEEVKESKPLPQQGIQLVVDFPDASQKKRKALDLEMMMRRKINRVKKEYQVYMHKVHVLCWLGHGNYINKVINDRKVMAAVLLLVPSLKCYPGERTDIKYIEQLTEWYRNKFTLKQDKHEDKFKPAPYSLPNTLISEIMSRVITTKRNMILIYVCLLRAIGIQCRVMFNFITLPLKPPASELCSLSTKYKTVDKNESSTKTADTKKSSLCKKGKSCKRKKDNSDKIPQLDGNFDVSSDSEFENVMQVDGNDDTNKKRVPSKTRSKASCDGKSNKDAVSSRTRTTNQSVNNIENKGEPSKIQSRKKSNTKIEENTISKSARATKQSINLENKGEASKSRSKTSKKKIETDKEEHIDVSPPKISRLTRSPKEKKTPESSQSINTQPARPRARKKTPIVESDKINKDTLNVELTQNSNVSPRKTRSVKKVEKAALSIPDIVITPDDSDVCSKYFDKVKEQNVKNKLVLSRKRSRTTNNNTSDTTEPEVKKVQSKTRTKSAPGTSVSKYFTKKDDEDSLRVSHKDLVSANKSKSSINHEIKSEINVKNKSKKKTVKVEKKPVDNQNTILSSHLDSDDDFKPPRSGKIDRRVLSPEISASKDKKKKGVDVWCEVYIEELEQWVAIDVLNGKVHCPKSIYENATHPIAYIVGWNNNNHLKDLTRRYVPYWNTVTRKLRAEPPWWEEAIKPWLAPLTPFEREENEQLDRMQLEAPLPKTIHEYKNHPLYALKRHLLKFEALYPPNAATLGFIRGEAVYARDCVYICRSRDTWLKEAKVVKMGEKPYKIVKARPKWDKLSNKVISDQPLEVFGPWQVQPYEPPTAENGIVPRNAYGNVELFKACMLPKGTVHIKLPGLNKIARKLEIDCAPAMTGFDFNGGYTHPVFDGFVVCKEFEDIIRNAYDVEQEEQERREREKIEQRVYGNWKKLIKGLLIRERLKDKYGFKNPPPKATKKSTGPRFLAKKKS